jgi:hypothetical protein
MKSLPVVLLCLALALGSAKKVAHSALPRDGCTDSIDLTLYLKGAGDLHYLVAPAGGTEPTPEAIKKSKVGGNIAQRGTTQVAKPGRVAREVDGLKPATKYDVFFVIEATGSNGVFGSVNAIIDVTTHSAAPTIAKMTAATKSGSTTEIAASFELDKAGLVNYILIKKGYDAPKAGADVKGAILSNFIHAKGSVDVKDANKAQQLDIKELTAGQSYELYFVSEAAGSNGVFSGVSSKLEVETHQEAPAVVSITGSAKGGSAVAAIVSYELSAAGLLHYIVLKKGGAKPKDGATLKATQKSDAVPAKGEMESKGGRSETLDISNLRPGEAYDIYCVSETAGSGGVYGTISEVLSITTHKVAPQPAGTPAAQPKAGIAGALTIGFSLAEAGLFHYVVLPKGTAAPADGSALLKLMAEARGASGDARAAAKVAAKAYGSVEVGAELLSKQERKQEIDGLEGGEAYDTYFVTETSGSDGVFSAVTSAPTATTHAPPPALNALSAEAKDGSAKAVTVGYTVGSKDATGGAVIHYIVVEAGAKLPVDGAALKAGKVSLDTTGAAGSDKELDKPAVAKGSVEPKKEELGKELQLEIGTGLKAGISYDVLLVVETPQSQGVFGEVSTKLTVTTHADAPALVTGPSTVAVPKNGSSTEVLLRYAVGKGAVAKKGGAACTLHYAVMKKGAKVPLNGAELLAKDNGAVSRGTLAVEGGGADGGAGEEVLTLLDPGQEYEVYAVTETDGSNGVYGLISPPLAVKTHAPPPALTGGAGDAVKAAPKDATTDTILLTHSLSTSGVLHYVVLAKGGTPPTDGADLVAISKGTKDGAQAGLHAMVASGEVAQAQASTPTATEVTLEVAADADYGAAGQEYEVYVVTETSGSFGLYGDVNGAKGEPAPFVVATHGVAPALGAHSLTPVNASTTQLVVDCTVSVSMPAGGGDKNDKNTIIAIAAKSAPLVHFVVIGGASPAPKDGHALVAAMTAKSATTKAYGTLTIDAAKLKAASVDVEEGEDADIDLQVSAEVKNGLEAGKEYTIYFVTETAGSNGVYSTVSAGAKASTHKVAPSMAPPKVSATAGAAGSLGLIYQLNEAGVFHFVVLPAGASAPADGTALLKLSSVEGKGPPLSGSVEVAKADIKKQQELVLAVGEGDGQKLEGGVAYDVYVVTETSASNGVFGAVSSKATGTTFKEAPAWTLNDESESMLAVSPKEGTTDSLHFEFALEGAAVVHYLVLAAPIVEGKDGVVDDRALQKVTPSSGGDITSAKVAGSTVAKASIDITEKSAIKTSKGSTVQFAKQELLKSLKPGTAYAVFAVAETSGSKGVFGDISGPLTVFTHADAPAFAAITTGTAALPTVEAHGGRTNALVLKYALGGSKGNGKPGAGAQGLVHYAVLAKGLAGYKTGEEVLAAADAKAKGTVSASSPGEVVVNELQAGTAYEMFVVTETEAAEAGKGTGVFGSVVAKVECATHATPPTIDSDASAQPVDGSTVSVSIKLTLSRPGTVHYALLRTAPTTPAALVGWGSDEDKSLSEVVRGSFLVDGSPPPAAGKGGAGAAAAAAAVPSGNLVNIAVAHSIDGLRAGSQYTVHLLSETLDSEGVYAPNPSSLEVRTHAEAPPIVAGKPSKDQDSSTAAAEKDPAKVALAECKNGQRRLSRSGGASDGASVTPTCGSSTSLTLGMSLSRTGNAYYIARPAVGGKAGAAPTAADVVAAAKGADDSASTAARGAVAKGKDAQATPFGGVVVFDAKADFGSKHGSVGKLHEAEIDGLEAGASYEIFIVSETLLGPNGAGVFSSVAVVPVVSTWAAPPALDALDAAAAEGASTLSVSPSDGSATAAAIELDFAGKDVNVHYAVQLRTTTESSGLPEPAIVGGAAVSENRRVNGFDVAVDPKKAKEPTKMPTGIVACGSLQQGEKGWSAALRALNPNTEYTIMVSAEPVGSAVFGALLVSNFSTHPGPPTLTSFNAWPSSGSATKATLEYQLTFPPVAAGAPVIAGALLHYALYTWPLSDAVAKGSEDGAPSPLAIKSGEGAVVSGSVEVGNGIKGEIVADGGLVAAAQYIAVAVAESATNSSGLQGTGVFSASSSTAVNTRRLRTFAEPPALADVELVPLDGSSSGLQLSFQLSMAKDAGDAVQEARVHYAVLAVGSSSLALAAVNSSSLLKQIATGAGGATPFEVVAEAGKDASKPTVAAKGSLAVELDSSGLEKTLLLESGLQASVEYTLLIVTETPASDIFGSGANAGTDSDGAPLPVVVAGVATHGEAPSLVTSRAVPAQGQPDSLLLSAQLSAPGTVHYIVLLASDGVRASAILDGDDDSMTLGGTVVHQGSIEVGMGEGKSDAIDAKDGKDDEEDDLAISWDVGGLQPATAYEVVLVSEAPSSNGVYGPLSPRASVSTFGLPPSIVADSVRAEATDGSANGVTIHFNVTFTGGADAGCAVHYLLKSGTLEDAADPENPLTADDFVDAVQSLDNVSGPVYAVGSSHVDANMPSAVGSVVITGLAIVENLPPNTVFDIYLVVETGDGDTTGASATGVYGDVIGPVVTQTHANPDAVSQDVDCANAPECATLHRDECWLQSHTCGECLDGFHGDDGAANTACTEGEEAKAKAEADRAKKQKEEEAQKARGAEKAKEAADKQANVAQAAQAAIKEKEAQAAEKAKQQAAAKASKAQDEAKRKKEVADKEMAGKKEAASAAASAAAGAAAKAAANAAASAAKAAAAGAAAGGAAAAEEDELDLSEEEDSSVADGDATDTAQAQAAAKTAAMKVAAAKAAAAKAAAQNAAKTAAAQNAAKAAGAAAKAAAAAKQAVEQKAEAAKEEAAKQAAAAAMEADAEQVGGAVEDEDELDLSDDAEEDDAAGDAAAGEADLEKRAKELEDAAMAKAEKDAAKAAPQTVAQRIEAAKAAARRQYEAAAAQANADLDV